MNRTVKVTYDNIRIILTHLAYTVNAKKRDISNNNSQFGKREVNAR